MQNLMNDIMKVKLLYSHEVTLVQGKDQQLYSQQLEMNFSMWSNDKDYFHHNLFPRLAQGVLYLKQRSSAPMALHTQVRMMGTFIPPTYKKGCTGLKQRFIQTNVLSLTTPSMDGVQAGAQCCLPQGILPASSKLWFRDFLSQMTCFFQLLELFFLLCP